VLIRFFACLLVPCGVHGSTIACFFGTIAIELAQSRPGDGEIVRRLPCLLVRGPGRVND